MGPNKERSTKLFITSTTTASSSTTTIISTSTRKAIKITTKQTTEPSFSTERYEKKPEKIGDSKPNDNNVDEDKMYTYSIDEATTYNIIEVDTYSETPYEEEKIDDIVVEPVAESTIEEEIE